VKKLTKTLPYHYRPGDSLTFGNADHTHRVVIARIQSLLGDAASVSCVRTPNKPRPRQSDWSLQPEMMLFGGGGMFWELLVGLETLRR
jgi:hypothetical protein